MPAKKITVMVVPEKGRRFAFSFSPVNFKVGFLSAAFFALLAGYFTIDYFNLRMQRSYYQKIQKENKIIKSEALLLTQNLEGVKKSLGRVQDYAQKITEIVNVKLNTIKFKTGIGPLTKEEAKVAKEMAKSSDIQEPSYPLGLNVDKLAFKPVFSKLSEIQLASNHQAHELQQLLSSLSQKKSLLSSIPTITPAKGWVASGFGERISPFTGAVTRHRGVDIAAPAGTPIYATADGVVIFSGVKPDFGNLVVIAHYENGITTKYGHCAQNFVYTGQRISRGEQIASIGMSGNTTGPHVHYEVWVDGHPQNPFKFILDNTNLGLL